MPNNIATIGDRIETDEEGLLETEHAALHDEEGQRSAAGHELEDLEAIVDEDPDDGGREPFMALLPVQPVADFDARMQSIEAQRAEIRAKVNDGELDYDAAEAQLDALADQRSDLRAQQQHAEFSARQNASYARQEWQREVTGFLQSHPAEYERNPVRWGALDATVKRLANEVEVDEDGEPILGDDGEPYYLNADRGARWFLEEAHRLVSASFGGTTARGYDARADSATLREGDNDPGARARQHTGGRGDFRDLDNLTGFELEEALQRLPQHERDAYLRGD